MLLTEQQLEETTLRISQEMRLALNDDEAIALVRGVIATMPKPKPVAWQSTNNSLFVTTSKSVVKGWESSGYEVRNLYAEAHIAPPASEQKPMAWATTNEDGDYVMLFFDKQEALIYSGDDEPIGLAPVSSSAPQPDYKAQRDAERYRWLRDQFWCEQEATFRLGLPDTESATIYNNALDAAIDAAIASVKGGE